MQAGIKWTHPPVSTGRRARAAFLAGLAVTGLCAFATAGKAQEAPAPPFVLVVYASGGWDQTMVFDPKIGSGYVDQEAGAAAATGRGGIAYVDHPDRPAVKAFFDTYGEGAAIVNGIDTGSMERRAGAESILGTVPPDAKRPVDWLSYYAGTLSPVMKIPHLVIDAPLLPGEYSGLTVRVTTADLRAAGTAPADATLTPELETALAAFRSAVWEDAPNSAHSDSLDGEKLRALHYGQAREASAMNTLATINASLGAQGTESDFVRNGKVAIELFATGAGKCATIQAFGTNAWDTFAGHHAAQNALFEDLFDGLNRILDYAASRQIGDKLLLLVVSDGGKSPRLNARGGKGPWPYTSMLLWGAFVKGGVVLGKTDAALRGMPVDPLFGGEDLEDGVTLTSRQIWSALLRKAGASTKAMIPKEVDPLSPLVATGESQ